MSVLIAIGLFVIALVAFFLFEPENGYPLPWDEED